MVYIEVLIWLFAAGVLFVSMFLLTPIVYAIWHSNLSSQVSDPTLQAAGDNFYNSWKLLSYIVPGILIAAAFATAARKRSSQVQEEY